VPGLRTPVDAVLPIRFARDDVRKGTICWIELEELGVPTLLAIGRAPATCGP